MKIKVTSRIELNGKVEEKSAEASVAEDQFITTESPTEVQRASECVRALFENMNPPMVVDPKRPETPEDWRQYME